MGGGGGGADGGPSKATVRTSPKASVGHCYDYLTAKLNTPIRDVDARIAFSHSTMRQRRRVNQSVRELIPHIFEIDAKRTGKVAWHNLFAHRGR
jgi:hypothetical protein